MIIADTADGWNSDTIKIIKKIRSSFWRDLLLFAWNVDCWKAAIALIKAWADWVKVWIWPWWMCETRTETWFGTPQFTAIWNTKEALTESYPEAYIIWDWWIKTPWDFCKAKGIGADLCMMWSAFKWTDLTPWDIILDHTGKIQLKLIRWMASAEETKIVNNLKHEAKDNPYWFDFSEWASHLTPYKWEWSTQKVLTRFASGLASSFTYANARSSEQYYRNTKFQLVTNSGHNEWKPHAAIQDKAFGTFP